MHHTIQINDIVLQHVFKVSVTKSYSAITSVHRKEATCAPALLIQSLTIEDSSLAQRVTVV